MLFLLNLDSLRFKKTSDILRDSAIPNKFGITESFLMIITSCF